MRLDHACSWLRHASEPKMLQLVSQFRDELRAKGLYRDCASSNEQHGRNHDGDKRDDATMCNSDGERTDDGTSVIEALLAAT